MKVAAALQLTCNHVRCRLDPVGYARRMGVTIGDDCRLLSNPISTFGSEPFLVSLGDHVTVTAGVSFVTHDGGVWVFRETDPDIDVFGRITVGNNVFLGLGAMLMPGVTIGDNCVVGARSVVTRDVQPGTVVAGVPARPICTIAEYRDRVLARAVRIKGMSASAKREFLLEHPEFTAGRRT